METRYTQILQSFGNIIGYSLVDMPYEDGSTCKFRVIEAKIIAEFQYLVITLNAFVSQKADTQNACSATLLQMQLVFM